MLPLLLKFVVAVLAVFVAEYIVPGVMVESLYAGIIVAVILGLLNLIVRPILLLLTLPITLITFGLFAFVINALLFWFTASFIEGFYVSGFFAAFLGALVVSVINWLAERFL